MTSGYSQLHHCFTRREQGFAELPIIVLRQDSPDYADDRAEESNAADTTERRFVAQKLDDVVKTEKLISSPLERAAPRRPATRMLEGSTVTRLRLPIHLRRSPACTNIIENKNGSICKKNQAMSEAAMMEGAKGFR